MNIPGLKVLDEVLAGLPTNSAQRLEIGRLKEQIAALQKENEELKQKLASYLTIKTEPELIRDGDAYYKKDANGAPVGHPYCINCWENDHRLSSITNVMSNLYRCPVCKNTCRL